MEADPYRGTEQPPHRNDAGAAHFEYLPELPVAADTKMLIGHIVPGTTRIIVSRAVFPSGTWPALVHLADDA
jgi:hypothetical protein